MVEPECMPDLMGADQLAYPADPFLDEAKVIMGRAPDIPPVIGDVPRVVDIDMRLREILCQRGMDDERPDNRIVDEDRLSDIPGNLDAVDATDALELDIGMGEPDFFRDRHVV